MSSHTVRRWAALAALAAVLRGDHGTGAGKSFTFLDSGFRQELIGVLPAPGFLGGVAFAPDGDVWVNTCQQSGGPLYRFDLQGVAPEMFGTRLHPRTQATGGAGCGMANHADGFLYSNTVFGVVRLDANAGTVSGALLGPPGNALGIASDAQTGDLATWSTWASPAHLWATATS